MNLALDFCHGGSEFCIVSCFLYVLRKKYIFVIPPRMCNVI